MRLDEFVEFLGLKSPFRISIRSDKCKDADALYMSVYKKKKLDHHRIIIYAGNNSRRCIETLAAHELIHAWQTENDMSDIHGESFRKIAKRMSKEFSLPLIYINGVDEE